MGFPRFPRYFSYNHKSQELIIEVHFSVRVRKRERCFRKKFISGNFVSGNFVSLYLEMPSGGFDPRICEEERSGNGDNGI